MWCAWQRTFFRLKSRSASGGKYIAEGKDVQCEVDSRDMSVTTPTEESDFGESKEQIKFLLIVSNILICLQILYIYLIML